VKLTPEQEKARYECIDCGRKEATYSEPVCSSCRAIFAEWEPAVRKFSCKHNVPLRVLYNMMGTML
jgi:predicted RNA-binding Zn-ribbon protein involved in translation (DUF1610 family)